MLLQGGIAIPPEMSSFTFKHFVVKQDRCAMKVGTDGVILGAWATAKEGKILDVGTGTGLIALILAQRTKTAEILGVEIDQSAAQQAQENVHSSLWNDRISIINKDVFSLDASFCFDEIISNPPYYIHSPASSSKQRDTARKAMPDFYGNLVKFVCVHLNDDGVFEVILPENIKDDFIYLCWENDLYLSRQTLVYTKEGKQAKRALLCFTRHQCDVQKDVLVMMNAQNEKTDSYKRLIKDLYLD